MSRSIASVMSVLFSASAYAGPPVIPVSEPGTIALLGVGTVAAVVIAIRKRRK